MRHLLFLLFMLPAFYAHAQQTIIESLEEKRPEEGTVNIYQSPQIKSYIGQRYVPNIRKTLKGRGFRIQVYVGNNSRSARSEAYKVAQKVKEEFPDIPVYTYFQPPRWLCRVGDYKSIEEAHVVMRKLKDSGKFKEVAIVREQINIPIE